VKKAGKGCRAAPGWTRRAGYEVAGKTGTAQQVNPDCGCYSADK